MHAYWAIATTFEVFGRSLGTPTGIFVFMKCYYGWLKP